MNIISNLTRALYNKLILRYDIYFFLKIFLIYFLSKLSIKNFQNKPYEDILIFIPEGLGDITIFKSLINRILILNKKKRIYVFCINNITNKLIEHFFKNENIIFCKKIPKNFFYKVYLINPNIKPLFDIKFLNIYSKYKIRITMLPNSIFEKINSLSFYSNIFHINFSDINKVADKDKNSNVLEKILIISTHSNNKKKFLSKKFLLNIISFYSDKFEEIYIFSNFKFSFENKKIKILDTMNFNELVPLFKTSSKFIGIDSFLSNLAYKFIDDVTILGELGNTHYRYKLSNYIKTNFDCYDCRWLCYNKKLYSCISNQENLFLRYLKTTNA